MKNHIFNNLYIIIILFCIVLIFVIFHYKINYDLSKVNIISTNSEIYSEDDINDSIKTTLKFFNKNFKGCNLLSIGYIGDEKNNDYIDWARKYNKDEVIVLISNFETDSFVNGGLNPNYKYEDWIWILVRNKNEKWKHVDHGY